MAESALYTVSSDSVPDGAADHEAESGRPVRRVGKHVSHEGGAAAAPAGARHTLEVVTAGEAVRRGEHGREDTDQSSR